MKGYPPVPTRARWLFAFGIIVVSVCLFGAVCRVMELSGSPRVVDLNHVAQLRLPIIVQGMAGLVAAVAWLRFRVDGKIGEDGRELVLSPSQFLTDSLVALSLSNFCAISGLEFFFLGAPLMEFALFALGALVIDFAFVLPRGLQFWAANDKRNTL